MKLGESSRTQRAMTFVEVVVVIAVVALLVFVMLPALLRPRHHNSHPISCINNLKQVGLAVMIWREDNNDQWPQSLSITNNGAMELISTGNVAAYFEIMSNELATPVILHCPADREHTPAQFFTNLSNANVSYFVNPNANDAFPENTISGDNDLLLDGVPVKSGVIDLGTNGVVSWSKKRHAGGNVVLADGSVAQIARRSVTNLWPDLGTNHQRLAIP